MRSQGNVISPKETNKAPIIDHKEMEIYEQSGKKFRIIHFKKFSDQEHTTTKQN